MAIVTGYTAARMKEIEDSAVVNGEVVGDDLFLEPFGFATDPVTYPKINAGNVRGPQGDEGPMGEVTEAELTAGLAATRVPAGVISMFGGAAAPATWALCDGGESNRTTDADLFAAIGLTYGVGNGTTTFNRPDLRSRFPVGKGAATWSDALNESGGSANAVLVSHAHTGPNHQHVVPAHEHSMSHGHATATSDPANATHAHTGTTDDDGTHQHWTDFIVGAGHKTFLTKTEGTGANGLSVVAGTDFLEWTPQIPTATSDHQHNFTTNNANATHAHTVPIPAYVGNTSTLAAATTSAVAGATSTEGVSATNANLPPYLTVNFIIKL